MHFNENFGRPQAITRSGQERIQIVFPKQKQGEFTPKIVPVPKCIVSCKHYASKVFNLLFTDMHIIPTG